MNAIRVVVAGGGAVMAMWWALGSGPRVLRAARSRLRREGAISVVLWWLPGPITASAAWLVSGNAAAAVALGMVAAATGRVLRLSVDMRLAAAHTESISRFATVLANQATAAPSVTVAIETAAVWATGSVAPAARNLAAGMQTLGVFGACSQFADEIAHPLGSALAATITSAHRSGSEWAKPVSTLAQQADQTAVSMRLLERHVGSKMPMLAALGMLGAGLLIGFGVVMPDLRPWYSTPTGQATVMLTGICFAAICYQIIAAARRELVR